MKLEEVQPVNALSAQLGALFLEAYEVFSEVYLHGKRYTTGRMISKVLNIVKLENIADQVLEASEASRSNRQIVSEVLKIVKPEKIAERIEASKPSRSSSQITTEMVGFVETLLDCTMSCLTREQGCHHGIRDGCGSHFGESEQLSASVLEKKLQHLRVLFMFTAKWCVEHESMTDFFSHVEAVAYTVSHLIGLGFNMETELSKFQKTIIPFRPEVRKMYLSVLIGSKSSRSETTVDAHYMSDFLKALQEDLEELLSHDVSLKEAFDNQIPWLQQGLSYLSRFLLDVASKCTPLKESSSLQSHIEALSIETAIVIYSFYDEMDKTIEIDHLPFHLQLKFIHFKVEVDLIQLLNSQVTIIAPLKNLTDYVQEELVFLRTFLMDSLEQCKEHTKLTDLLTLIQSVTSQAWSIINSLSHDSVQEDLAMKINHLHFQLLLQLNFIKASIRQMCPNISASSTLDHPTVNLLNFLPINFEVIDSYFSILKSSMTSSSDDIPTIDEVLMGFHKYILHNLLLKDETYLTFTVSHEVKKFFYGLLLLVTYIFDPLVQRVGCIKQNDLLTEFGTIVPEDESAICLIYQEAADSKKSRKVNFVLQFLIFAFKLMESEGSLMNLLEHKTTLKAQILDLIENAHEELVFLRSFLMDVLTQHTDLNKLHDLLMHAEVSAHKLAQISGSCYGCFTDGSSTEKMTLWLSDLLQEIESVKAEFRNVCFQLLDASPCNLTDGEGLINFLLNHQDGLLNCDTCSVTFLKNQISLVKEKQVYLGSFLADIVQYRDMHQELKDLVKCLQDVKGQNDLSQSSRFFRKGFLCLRSLTDHFAESYDEHDEVYRLITSVTEMAYKAEYVTDSCLTLSHPLWYKVLWMSEVVENIKLVIKIVSEACERKMLDETVPEVAKTSTSILPSLFANTPRANEKMEGFQDETNAKHENFFRRINRFSGEDMFPEKSKEYRLFVHSFEDQIDLWQPSHSNVRSLLFNVIDPGNLLWPRDISFIFDSFKLVKVLDLESFNIGGTFPSEIQFLIHLRYFAAQTGGNSIPSSIAKLWNLETFVVRGLGVEVVLPSSLLTMVKMRNIHVNHCASISLHENMGESLADSQLDNLETFSTPHLSYGEDTEMILRKMPKLRKLSCIFSGTFGYSEKVKGRCVFFPRLEFLSHLESLKLVSNSYPSQLPHVFSFPSTLRELTLSKFRLPWSQISTIGELPNLEILKLLLRAFEGDEWEVKDLEFPELKYLELDDLNIAQWSVPEDAFPMLERLVLTKCKRLGKIPYPFEEAVCLKSIEVNWCSWSAANSAQEIQTTQHEDMANDAFKVIIQPPDWARS
ncbi:hypothetical protein K7X08_006351 [Anisodus acutangulus]|uniref:Late blight resistance protein R1A-like N-terminal domain-containing protein n=1 Tax=Anisodus acutangulus TaxID=402998 RepID=A0A9Q1RRJ6_9SOLA|nr:hypothetical protein K7X08_006351 [Anisodus acutangulus]